MKPHIKLRPDSIHIHARWWCIGDGHAGFGPSPKFSYIDWQMQKLVTETLGRLMDKPSGAKR